ncbi:MAG: energy-coupling factor transporter transmembrane protein EcfT [Sphaerochaetaceae bacterium]|nr:energy-coupling factor transporter transmembrane protein EcfT [Sphaerochaetaceae bacterium]
MTNIFNYIERKSPIHSLTGATKLLCLLIWSLAAMTTFDTRLLAVMPVFAVILFIVSKIRLKDVKIMFWFSFVFMLLNNILIFLFSPEHGTTIYGTRTVLFPIFWRYIVTKEQLFYQLNVVLKYLATIPIVILFVSTTDPSEFASSLNRIGVSYKIAYSVSLALRYIPDIQREYHDISMAQQARGLEMASGKQKLIKRLKNAADMLFPLIVSSMDRIEIIASAMELRGFGKNKKRTWYSARPFRSADYLSIAFCVILAAVSVYLHIVNGSRYYNPFI